MKATIKELKVNGKEMENEKDSAELEKLADEHAEKANDIYVKEHPFPNQVPDYMQIRLMDMFKAQAKKDFIAGLKAAQSNLPETVFVKVSVEDRLPGESNRYWTLKGIQKFVSTGYFDGDSKRFDDNEFTKTTHWLEETAAPRYSDAEEQIDQEHEQMRQEQEQHDRH